MKKISSYWRLRLPLFFATADLAWTLSAFRAAPVANPADSVGMINTVVWVFLHLPAAYLGSLPFKNSPVSGGAFPQGQLITIGAFGVLQMAALAWALGFWLDKKKTS